MRRVFFDASGLAKRYAPEPGSDMVDLVFDKVLPTRMYCLMLGAGEVASVLVRRHNAGKIRDEPFLRAYDELLRDVIRSVSFNTLSTPNDEIEAALPYLQKYGLNITDAVLLHIALDVRAAALASHHDLLLVASDQRLLRAARAEGLETFDPEAQTEAELDALLAAP